MTDRDRFHAAAATPERHLKVTAQTRLAGRVGAAMTVAERGAGAWHGAPAPDLTISSLIRHTDRAEIDVGAGRFRAVGRPGDFVAIPPGCASAFLTSGLHEFRLLSVPYAALRALAGDGAGLPADGDFGALHSGCRFAPEVIALLDRLWREGREGGIHGALHTDGLLLQLTASLLRLRGERAGVAPAHASLGGGLTAWQLRRVDDYMMAHLDHDIALVDLAGCVGRSRFHFAHAFKRATGLPPHRYLMRRRVERAKGLLANSDRGLAEVALACGFAGQSHFTTAFKRHVGVTPGAWRGLCRERCGRGAPPP